MHGFLPVWIFPTTGSPGPRSPHVLGHNCEKGCGNAVEILGGDTIGKTESGAGKVLYVFQLQKLHQMSNIQRIQKTHQESSLPLEFCLKPQRIIQIIIQSSSFVLLFIIITIIITIIIIIIIIIIFTIICQCVCHHHINIYISIYIYIYMTI